MTGLDWTFTAIWLVLWAGGLALLAWALFAGRAKGRPRCDRCRYSLAGLDLPATTAEPPIPCPECGRPIRSLKQALRTRRRPIIAVFAVLLILAAPVVWRVPEAVRAPRVAGQFSWRSLIPGPVLLGLLALQGWHNASRDLSFEAHLRLEENSYLARWYAAARSHSLVYALEHWPVGVPIPLDISHGVIFAGPERKRSYPNDPRLDSFLRAQPNPHLWLEPLPEGRHALEFLYVPRLSGAKAKPIPFTREMTVSGDVASVLRPVTGPDADAQVRSSTSVRVVLGPGWPDDMLGVNAALTSPLSFSARAAISFEYDGAPVTLRSVVVPTTEGVSAQFAGERVVELKRAIARGDTAELGRWTVVLNGDPAVALSDLIGVAYWSGTLRIPITEALKP